MQSGHLIGYGIILYFIPTAVCIMPKETIHTIMLLLAAILRGVFLGRNFASRMTTRGFIIYFVIAAIEGLNYFVVKGTFFTVHGVNYNPHYVAVAAAGDDPTVIAVQQTH